jgi:hypothetical protein
MPAPDLGPAAIALRTSGANYADIAETLGLADARAALQCITRELERQGMNDLDAKERLRAETAVQLDALLASVWIKAENPSDPEHITAVRTAVTVLDRRIRLLGLDAPSEVIVHTPTTTELEQWVAHLVKGTMPQLREADIVDIDSHDVTPLPPAADE